VSRRGKAAPETGAEYTLTLTEVLAARGYIDCPCCGKRQPRRVDECVVCARPLP
jgi:hypothetical protein